MLYLDSSALVKRYVAEVGTDLVQTAIREDPCVATVMINAVEVRAALAAAARARRIPDTATPVTTFLQEWERYIVLGIDAALVDAAGELAERHALSGYDAEQLAAALMAAQAAPGAVRCGAFDRAPQRAAQAGGLPLLFPP